MSSPKPTLALFGATGGCINAVLNAALAAGYSVNCLVRTPSKLSSLSAQYPNLHLIQGDVYSLPSIRETLLQNGRVVDIIVSGIGMTPVRKGLGFSFQNTDICESTAKNMLQVLGELEREDGIAFSGNGLGPRLVLLSTTGISDRGRDIPLAMVPFYHYLLATPHKDKKKMEEVVIPSGRQFVLIRPSLLFDGEGKGTGAVRTGIEVPGEEGKVDGKGVGYAIKREDVGAWIFEETIAKGDVAEKWEGKIVSLTY